MYLHTKYIVLLAKIKIILDLICLVCKTFQANSVSKSNYNFCFRNFLFLLPSIELTSYGHTEGMMSLSGAEIDISFLKVSSCMLIFQ